jgi:hypothetical protein
MDDFRTDEQIAVNTACPVAWPAYFSHQWVFIVAEPFACYSDN